MTVSVPSDPVAIVGAGVCGLSAAIRLRDAGIPAIVLEAGPRPGGRARTAHPAVLHGLPFDDGASWFHLVDHNPLADLVRRAGARLDPAHDERRRLVVDGRPAAAAEQRAYDDADRDWRAFAAGMAADPAAPDRPLSAAGDAWNPNHPWLANIEHWEGAIIAAADADSLSLRDWHLNQLDGDDLLPHDGLGTLVLRHLVPSAGPLSLDTAVHRIDADVSGGAPLLLHTTAGTVRASACIVTVSTGVLRAGRIAFAPELPPDILAALDGLPMGLLAKAAFHLSDPARFADGVPELVEWRLPHRGAPAMLLTVNAARRPLATAYLGGRHALDLEPHPADLLAEFRDRLAAAYGFAAAATLPGPDPASGHVTAWSTDPRFAGAYAFARPGHADARAALGRPFAGGRVVIAGEACRADGLAGTVGGAFLDGHRAADAVITSLRARSTTASYGLA
ncbi:MAG: FAD-dependent oxidoreductase [Caulobacteraceae bacterium]|nr:FAD-dependent oxidoreductase [Caulobacter sp.]